MGRGRSRGTAPPRNPFRYDRPSTPLVRLRVLSGHHPHRIAHFGQRPRCCGEWTPQSGDSCIRALAAGHTACPASVRVNRLHPVRHRALPVPELDSGAIRGRPSSPAVEFGGLCCRRGESPGEPHLSPRGRCVVSEGPAAGRRPVRAPTGCSRPGGWSRPGRDIRCAPRRPRRGRRRLVLRRPARSDRSTRRG